MSSLTTWLWGTSQLDDAVEKATSELLPAGEENIALNLEICDQIRSKSAPAKEAMRALKQRLNHKNPNVQLLALGLTDVCIKNGGDHFLVEVASREFMDNLVSILKIPVLNIEVKNTILRLIQNWSTAFEGKPMLGYVGQVYKTLKSEGFKFPPQDLVVANSAMVDTQTAPEWIDSDVCLRCRTPFSFTNRKHHCRNCGQVFDQQCSAKSMPLPHFGITQDVRVCDGCYSKLSRKADRAHDAENRARRHSSSNAHSSSRHRSARELADAELQRAIQLSLQDVGGSGNARPGYVPSQPSPSAWQYSEPPIVDRSSHPNHKSPPEQEEDEDPDLRAAIEASLREANAPKPSAPAAVDTPSFEGTRKKEHTQQAYTPDVGIKQRPPSPPRLPNYDLEPLELDAIMTFSQTVEQAQSHGGGRDISRYPAMTELHDKATGLRPKLAMSLDDTGRKEQILSDMHEKLSQAVKLYDQLLTQQVSQPRWRSSIPAVAAIPPEEQARGSYAQPVGVHDHNDNRWATTPQEAAMFQTKSPQRQPQYTPTSPPIQGELASPPKSAVLTPVQVAQLQRQLQYQQAPWSPSQQYTPQKSYGTPQPVMSPQRTNPGPASPSQLHPQAVARDSIPSKLQFSSPQQSSIAPAAQQNVYQSLTPASTSLRPAPLGQQQQLVAPSSSSAFAAAAQKSQPLPSPTLVRRHHTINASSSPYHGALPGNPVGNSYLTRHNTVARAPAPPSAHQYHPQYVASPPSSLPHFPSVPTSPPHPMYSPPVPSGPQPERKEALLIDL